MSGADRDASERAERLGRMIDDFLNAMSPQQRDRMMQAHLARARGPLRNAILLRQMTDAILAARRDVARAEDSRHG